MIELLWESDNNGGIRHTRKQRKLRECRPVKVYISRSEVVANLWLLLGRVFTVGVDVLGAVKGRWLLGTITAVLEVVVVHIHGLVDLGTKGTVISGTADC